VSWPVAFVIAFALVGMFAAGWLCGVLSAWIGLRHPTQGESDVATAPPVAKRATWPN